MKEKLYRVFLVVLVIGLSAEFVRWKSADPELDVNEVNVYSSRHEKIIEDLFEQFSRDTGIAVNLVVDEAPKLFERMVSDDEEEPADLLLLSNIDSLVRAQSAELFEPLKSEALLANIPDGLRDSDGHWFGLSRHIRSIFYRHKHLKPDAIGSYLDLADPKWKGKLLVSSSSDIYNQSLVAWMITKHGVDKTREWLQGLVANFARKPEGDDMEQLQALANGEGSVAIANSYYYAYFLMSEDRVQKLLAASIGILFPDQDKEGAHVNVSGGGVVAGSKNRDNAIKLLEFLAEKRAQKIYASRTFEYPAIEDLPLPDLLASFGKFNSDDQAILTYSGKLEQALSLAQEMGWD